MGIAERSERVGPPVAWGWWLVAICLGLASASLSYRWRAENVNRAVSLAVEAHVIREAAIGLPLSEPADPARAATAQLVAAMGQLRTYGLTAVVLQEQTVGDLLLEGRLEVTPDGALRGPALARTLPFLAARLGRAQERGSAQVDVSALSSAALRAVPTGLNPEEAQAAREAGLMIVARHANALGMSPALISETLRSSRKLGAEVFLPFGDQALGSRDLLEFTAETLRTEGYLYATPEFARIAGDSRLAKMLEDRLIRLHSIHASEVDRTAPNKIVERFARAYRERNQRLMLLRSMSAAQETPLSGLSKTLGSVRDALVNEGAGITRPRPFSDPGVPAVLVMALAVAAGLMTVWVAFALFSATWVRAIGVVSVLGAITLAWQPESRVYIALLAAISFPISAYQLWLGARGRSPWQGALSITAVSLVGGLTVAGLLNALPFLVKTDQFFAVKLAHFLPVFVIGWVLIREQADPLALIREPVRWGYALLALGFVAVLGLMVLRTGNESPDAVSGLELRLRDLLDALLFARPRTKEFLVGHPALWIGLCLASGAKGSMARMNWAALLLTVGALGQTSIVNTLCHLHSPLQVSLARIGIGLAFGLIVGSLVWVAVGRRLAGRLV